MSSQSPTPELLFFGSNDIGWRSGWRLITQAAPGLGEPLRAVSVQQDPPNPGNGAGPSPAWLLESESA